MQRAVLALLFCVIAVEAFAPAPCSVGGGLRKLKLPSSLKPQVDTRAALRLRMQVESPKTTADIAKEAAIAGRSYADAIAANGNTPPNAADPYALKKEVPSWAKEENQWELDQKAGEAEGDKNKKALAVATGAVAMVLSVLYLGMVAFLESRGPLQPPPCEATDTCEAVGDAVEAAALPMQHLILFALHL